MEHLGTMTGVDLKAKPLAFLQQHFGKSGRCSRIARESPLASRTPSPMISSRSRPLAPRWRLVEEVWRHCEAKALRGRTVTLKVKYADFQQITRSRTVGMAPGSASDVENIALSLLEPLFPTAKGIRLIGVTVSSFDEDRHDEPDQLSLSI